MPLRVRRVGVVPAGFQFRQRQCVLGRSPYTLLVDMWMNGDSGQERRAASSRFSVPSGVDFEIEERDRGGAIVRRLGGGVDDQVRLQLLHERQHTLRGRGYRSPRGGSPGISAAAARAPNWCRLRSEEDGSMVAVDSGDRESQPGEPARHFRADQTAGAGHENCSSLFIRAPFPRSSFCDVKLAVSIL